LNTDIICFSETLEDFFLLSQQHINKDAELLIHLDVTFNWLLVCIFLLRAALSSFSDHLLGPVVRVPGYRTRDPGSIPGATTLSEKSTKSRD
jgi:hypothetical protein